MADALWLQGFGVALRTLCLLVGGKQKKETKITISTERKMNIECHHRQVCTVQKHTRSPYATARLRQFGSSAAVSSSLSDPPWSGTWAAWCACHEPAHLVLGEVLLRGSWTAQGPSVPGSLGGTGTSVGNYGEPGGYPACYQCGVASAQCGGIGSPGAVVPLCQVTLLASFPSLHHAYHGSLVTPSVCFWNPPCVSPYPCA